MNEGRFLLSSRIDGQNDTEYVDFSLGRKWGELSSILNVQIISLLYSGVPVFEESNLT